MGGVGGGDIGEEIERAKGIRILGAGIAYADFRGL